MARRWSSAGLQHCVGCGVQRRARCREAPEAFREGFGSLPGRAGRAQAGRRQHNEVPLSKVRGPAVQGSRSRCARFKVPLCKVQGSRFRLVQLGPWQGPSLGPSCAVPGWDSQAGTPRSRCPRCIDKSESPSDLLAPPRCPRACGMPLSPTGCRGGGERGEEGWPRGGGGSRRREPGAGGGAGGGA